MDELSPLATQNEEAGAKDVEERILFLVSFLKEVIINSSSFVPNRQLHRSVLMPFLSPTFASS